ncbi:MAG TPA: hypothetical protein VJL37_10310 [Flavobacterium sp.]|nr:hypothetical protein [Flavobacterium sp.]
MKIYTKAVLRCLVFSLPACFSLHAQENELAQYKRDWRKYLQPKQLSEYIDSALTVTLCSTTSIPFKDLKYNKVIAYDYEGNEEPFGSITTQDGHFTPVVLKQRSLNQKQVAQLIKILTDKKTYGEGTAACFNPHMAVVFYDGRKIVFKADICFGCNYLIPSEDIPAMNHKKITFDDGGFYYFVGFTNSGKKKIKELAKELGFFYGDEQ